MSDTGEVETEKAVDDQGNNFDGESLIKRSARVSEQSSAIIKEAMELLGMTSTTEPTVQPKEEDAPLCYTRLTSSPDRVDLVRSSSTSCYSRPEFKRVDFDDQLDEILSKRRPASKALQECINDSYHRVKRTVSTQREEAENPYQSSRHLRTSSSSAFNHLDSDTDFRPSIVSRDSYTSPLLRRSSSSYLSSGAAGSGPYAAPAVSISQGIESRYDSIARNIEDRLLKTCPLPRHMKVPRTYSKQETKADEGDDDDYSVYMPRTYYSRPNRDDPDYFDYDLQHSVDLFKRPEGRYTPRGPQDWETKLVNESSAKGSTPLAGYMFTKGDTDWRSNGTSYLSAALRTPKFWEQRFEKLGKEVRDSNPLSLESVNRRIKQYEEIRRNRPITSRFTEYRDPDHEDYDNSDYE